ncbi:hypothetical protein KSS87_010551, partial [Heliosperma pusillum]
MMNTLLKHHHCSPPHLLFTLPSITKPSNSFSPTKLSIPSNSHTTLSQSSSLSSFTPKASSFSNPISSIWGYEQEKDGNFDNGSGQIDDLAHDSPVYQKTLRLVECSMFAAVAGLAYLLSNSLAIENYFGCFFALPIVITSMRWGVAAGRKTMVATTVLLFVLSGPVKALTYVVRAIGALGYVLTSSFLISENILALITINVHATLTLIFNSLGFTTVPSMSTIYGIFGTLLLCVSASYPIRLVLDPARNEDFIDDAEMVGACSLASSQLTRRKDHPCLGWDRVHVISGLNT